MDLKSREKFAEIISEMRGNRSYRSFARLIGVSHPTIAAWESMRGVPDTDNLRKIAALRGETLEQFEDFLRGGRGSLPESMTKALQETHLSKAELVSLLRIIVDRLEKSEG